MSVLLPVRQLDDERAGRRTTGELKIFCIAAALRHASAAVGIGRRPG
jgi:hypothetical protein